MNSRHALRRLPLLLIPLLLAGCAARDVTSHHPSRGLWWAYVGTYTGPKSKGLYVAKFDARTGTLSEPQLAAETPSPSFLAVDPQNRFLYAVNEVDQFEGQKTGSVTGFSIDHESGTLQPINTKPSGGAGPCHLAVDGCSRDVLVANYAAGSVEVLPIDDKGRLGNATTVIQHQGSGPDKQRQEGPHAHCITLDPGNHFALVNDLGLDKVLVYRWDSRAGKLTPNNPPSASVAPGAGPRHLAFSEDGKFAYVNNEMGLSVTAFRYDAKRGVLSEIQTLPTVPEGTPAAGNSTAEVRVHPSGKFVYVSNRGPDSIAIFRRDEKTGRLTAAGYQATQGKTPRSFSIDPTGQYLLAANQNSDNVVVFKIDPKTGQLAPTGTTVSVPSPVCVQFVPVEP
jgi:6-phosphogluconolactonase